jgi:mercuric ion binding protein
MTRLAQAAVLAGALLASSSAFAADKTVILAVRNMYCAACTLTVKASLLAVRGVKHAELSYKAKTAAVTYDDAETDVAALIAATSNAGYPSAPKS